MRGRQYAVAAVDVAQQRVADLRALLADMRAARDAVQPLSRPTGAVGAGGVWTCTAADRLHRDELAPMSQALVRAHERAEQSIVDELADAVRAHTGALEADLTAGDRSGWAVR